MKTENDRILSELDLEDASTVFTEFGIKEAHIIGLYMVKVARLENLPITIDVQIGAQQVFHYACEGTNEENDAWVRRKNNVTNHFGRSSFYVRQMLMANGETLPLNYGLDDNVYAAYGGSCPVRVKEQGVIGTITVSGLEDHLDHKHVTEAIRWYLNK